MRVLVTGAAGQVGTDLVRELSGSTELVAHDRRTLDLAEPRQIVERVREARPEVIVNAAAYTAVDRAEQERDLAARVNGVAPGVLAEEARRIGAVLIHYSTDYVFDGTKPAAYEESDATHPLSVYGATKLEGERAIAASGCDHLILRTSWVYAEHGRNFLLTMLRLAATRDELRVVDDQRGVPNASRQLARATRELIERGGHRLDALRAAGGIYHLSSPGVTTWFGFAQAIFETVSRRRGHAFTVPRLVPIPTSEYPTPARRPANSVLSSARLEAVFGVRMPDWRAGLEEVVSALPGP